MTQAQIQTFVLDYLSEIGAEVHEESGVFRVVFPPGRKRKFGGERRIVFDAAKAQPHVEVLEPGSPLLKLLIVDAKQWGGLGTYTSSSLPVGTLVFTFQFTTFTSLKKRNKFTTALLLPEATIPRFLEGIPELFHDPPLPAEPAATDVERVHNGLILILPFVEKTARAYAQDAVRESTDAFRKSLGRVDEYFQGLRQETFQDEARIKKRLGEIQSKLYFTEDGLRQLKLEKERDRLTQELYQLKKRRTESVDKLDADRSSHVERQRRRHEPKLQVRLVAATLIVTPSPEAPSVAAIPT